MQPLPDPAGAPGVVRADVVERDSRVMGPYATAGQYAQSPEPRGGGIVKDQWWQLWDEPVYPPVEFVVAALDTAYTTKAENDPSAMSVWGTFSGDGESQTTRSVDRYGRQIDVTRSYSSEIVGPVPKAMMMYAWQDRLEFAELVEKTASTCRRMKVDVLLIENKASGISAAQTLANSHPHAGWAIQMVDAKVDKVARDIRGSGKLPGVSLQPRRKPLIRPAAVRRDDGARRGHKLRGRRRLPHAEARAGAGQAVRQRERGGVRDGPRHVGHAIVHDAVDGVVRVRQVPDADRLVLDGDGRLGRGHLEVGDELVVGGRAGHVGGLGKARRRRVHVGFGAHGLSPAVRCPVWARQ